MKILTTILISLPLICAPLTASADKGGNKGPSDQAYEHANDNASFKHGDDYEKHDTGKNKKGDHDDADKDGHSRQHDDRDRDYHGSRDSNRYQYQEQNRYREKNRDNTDAGGNRGGGKSQ
jgi:hypothetical protein